MKRILQDNSGVALIVTILIISLIVSLTLQFNISMRSDLHAAANLRDGIKLGYIAKSGFNCALAVLREDASEGNVDSLLEAWADLKTLSDNSGALFYEGWFQVEVLDHSGRIQINKLVEGSQYNDTQRKLLTRFLKSPEFGLEDEEVENIVNAVKDWIDLDDEVTEGPGYGAESGYYQGLDKPYVCKNAPVEFIEELLLVTGVTKGLFYGTKEKPGIASYLSPYGDDGKININTAESLVLKAFSDRMDDQMVEDLVAHRKDRNNDLSDPNWYKTVPGMGDVTIAEDLLDASSTNFEIVSEGFKGAMAKRVTGMVKRTGSKCDILSWKIE